MNAEIAEFCDTNVIVYAYDVTAGQKRLQAKRLLDRLWDTGTGVVSVQILQELFVTLIRKTLPPLPATTARSIVRDLASWRVIEPTRHDVLEAIDGSLRWNSSFWDAMLLVAAKKAGAGVLWSEDLGDGQAFDGVVVRNPFQTEAEGRQR